MKKIIKRIRQYFKSVLGITKLENEISLLKRKNNSIVDKLETHSRWLNEMNSDNKLILSHIKFLNSQFSVISDINHPKYEPSVVIILRRGSEEIVKTYTFNNRTVEEIHRFLEGFGKENNRYDQPRGYPSPRWRY
ncbi:hypothetical protein [Flavobacterium hydrophilum]|uniref:Uncharacterized protein n=1 Tax=Flavobacterium hydrophilum TaxID=2211445 RepID=A0A2V4C327_9FLAO|nr:hypothetical protein [Flavobacterium hydrophilum]PXY44503.1 hypothetical protein DMB68_13630 [Flavobacterium hydrophilum]